MKKETVKGWDKIEAPKPSTNFCMPDPREEMVERVDSIEKELSILLGALRAEITRPVDLNSNEEYKAHLSSDLRIQLIVLTDIIDEVFPRKS